MSPESQGPTIPDPDEADRQNARGSSPNGELTDGSGQKAPRRPARSRRGEQGTEEARSPGKNTETPKAA